MPSLAYQIVGSFVCLFQVVSAVERLETLRYVHAVWRHGDRSAAHTFPTDTQNNESSWPQGFGELSPRGMRQHYELGKWLRRRYDGFLSDRYSSYEIYVRSTAYNRTIMSALANLAGLFEPHREQIWNPNITWQPIPVHSWPKQYDSLLYMALSCPNEDKLYEQVKNSAQVLKIEAENRHFLDFLAEKSGLELENRKMKLDDMWHLYDPINCERLHNDTHVVPDWVNETVWQKIVQLYHLSFTFFYKTVPIQRLRGGMLLGEIIDRMQRRANVSGQMDARERFYVYSAHDTTVMAFLANLGHIPTISPSYASVVLVELHERNGQHFVENLTMESEPIEVTIGDCAYPCTLERFLARSESRMVTGMDQWRQECGLHSWYALRPRTNLAVIAILLAFCICLLSVICVFVLVSIKRSRHRYRGRTLIPSTDTQDTAANS